MKKCTHMRRTALGDEALVNEERIREIIPEFRSRYPDDEHTDEELIQRFRDVLMSVPRNCPECTGGAS